MFPYYSRTMHIVHWYEMKNTWDVRNHYAPRKIMIFFFSREKRGRQPLKKERQQLYKKEEIKNL